MMNPNNPLTPGVYIQEVNAFPNSVVAVATAVPVFIGYTQKADYNGENLYGKPVQINSVNDYVNFFGGVPKYQISVKPTVAGVTEDVKLGTVGYTVSVVQNTLFYIYNSIRHFYENGGGKCCVISVGEYPTHGVQYIDLKRGIDLQMNEPEPTLMVIPDGLLLNDVDYGMLTQNMLAACNSKHSMIALFDIKGGDTFTNALELAKPDNIITRFRNEIGTNNLNYGAAYFPWLNTTIIQPTEIDVNCFDDTVNKAIEACVSADHTSADLTEAMLKAAVKFLNVLPVAPAMAGIYTAVDNSRGVWKAPANVSLNAVISPVYNFTDAEQGEGFKLNIDPETGKSINIIRSFPDLGVLVRGARTLDGNSQDWRYINVRRTMIMIEQSVKLAARAYVFEPNVANTWVTVECMISNFLNDLWKQGALAGAKPVDAYSVSVGLGSTMTGDDILNGIMRITVLVAVSHPAEFLLITFEQQMQKS